MRHEHEKERRAIRERKKQKQRKESERELFLEHLEELSTSRHRTEDVILERRERVTCICLAFKDRKREERNQRREGTRGSRGQQEKERGKKLPFFWGFLIIDFLTFLQSTLKASLQRASVAQRPKFSEPIIIAVRICF